jgi:predicted  nucleic acid-binding Zn-ribbon protein
MSKEEELEDQQTTYDKTVKEKAKTVIALTADLTHASEKVTSLQKRLSGIEESYNREIKDFETSIKRKQEQWDEQKATFESNLHHVQARNDQSMEFIESIRKDQIGLGPLIEQKISHYFNAAFQQLSLDEQESA